MKTAKALGLAVSKLMQLLADVSPRRLAGYRVFDQADNGGDDSARYAAADRLTEQLTDVDAARCALKNGQQCGIQRCRVSRRNASSRHIFTFVSGASRCWYAVMQAEEQNCMCQ